ncbi:MAG: type II secretion system F family protein [Deltaproteobacteria bacterium]
MKFIIFILIVITIYLYFYLVYSFVNKEKLAIKSRLNSIARKTKKNHLDEELSQPLLSRIVKPLADDITKIFLRITPREIINNFEKKIVMAGTPFKFTIREWTNLMVGIIVFLPLITIVTGILWAADPLRIVIMVGLEIISGFMIPNLILAKKMKGRKNDILKTLPDVIDLLTVSVEAGLGFDSALSKVVEKSKGQTANEFSTVIQEMKMGKPKRDALKEMSNRVGLTDMTTFIGAVIQADQLGVSIGSVLRIQSEQMRQKRRQRAQERAMKAPIKMLIPMVLFIFPTIFTVLIGPVIIKMVDMFMK